MYPANVQATDSLPWYKQFWPWVLIALPLASVVAGLTTLYIAVSNRDALVIEKWHKDGKAIYSESSSLQVAADFALHGSLLIDELTGEIFLDLKNQDTDTLDSTLKEFKYPKALLLKIVHPTLAARDQYLSLPNTSSQQYRGQLDQSIVGSRFLYLSDEDESWQIKFKMSFPSRQPVSFSATTSYTRNGSLNP